MFMHELGVPVPLVNKPNTSTQVPWRSNRIDGIREALPFTFDNVFEAVKTVRRWRRVAGELMGWADYEGSEDRKKLDAIERQHASDDARLKAVVEAFLLGEGPHQPSWRMLIHQLHKAGETNVAKKIKINAEPHQDPTMTVDTVTEILNKIPGHKWERVMVAGGLSIPWPLLKEIQRRCSTDTEKNHACADYYVNCYPRAEWKHLTSKLYWMEEFAAARKSKIFISTDPTLVVDNISHIMNKVKPKLKMLVWNEVLQHEMIQTRSGEEFSFKEEECADIYVNCYHFASWEHLAKSLYRHHQVAAVEEVRSYLPPRDLHIKKLVIICSSSHFFTQMTHSVNVLSLWK